MNVKIEPNCKETNIFQLQGTVVCLIVYYCRFTGIQSISINIHIFNTYLITFATENRVILHSHGPNVSLGTSDIPLSSGMAFIASCTFTLKGMWEICSSVTSIISQILCIL